MAAPSRSAAGHSRRPNPQEPCFGLEIHELLPEVRVGRAAGQRLRLLRVMWLTAKADAGRGRLASSTVAVSWRAALQKSERDTRASRLIPLHPERLEAAVASLEQVCREFITRELAYDAALASLDLSVLYLEASRSAEVRDLAVSMGR